MQKRKPYQKQNPQPKSKTKTESKTQTAKTKSGVNTKMQTQTQSKTKTDNTKTMKTRNCKPKPTVITHPDLPTLTTLIRTTTLHAHATATAETATKPTPTTKPDGGWVTDIDRQIQTHLLADLRARWPQYGFIGEEMTHADQVAECAQSRAGYWVLDPLDGTTNYTAGFLFYGVSLALVVDGQARLGVVYDPVRDECFCAEVGRGAFLNERRLTCPPTAALHKCIAIVDYKRLVGDLAAQLVRAPPFRSQRNLGASALEWCWLAAGRAHLYLHGGQKLWDFAAGHLILNEAGGAATSLSRLPLDAARLRKRSVVAAVNPTLLARWNEWINANSTVPKSSPL